LKNHRRPCPVATPDLILISVTVFFLELGLSAQYLDRVFDMFGIVPGTFHASGVVGIVSSI
jgi:hypothetical protein